MENRKLALSLLIVIFLLSGCSNGGNTQSTGGKAISVTGPEVSPTTIFEGSTISARVGLKNTGQLPATVIIGNGNGEVQGKRVLTDYCSDIFTIESFNARTTATSEDGGNSYKLQPKQEIQLNWQLKQSGGRVPLNGYSCNVEFTAPFNYSVEAFRQIQVKKSAESGGDPSLVSKSSTGPLNIEIETIGSSSDQGAPVFIKEDNIEVLIRWINKKPEESAYRGLIQIGNPKITASEGSLGSGCDIDEPIILYEGKSQVVQCSYDPAMGNATSVVREISATADYKYIKDIGSRSVKVKYGGN